MSEASHVYILSGQKFIKNAQNGQPEACGHAVLPDKSILKGQKVFTTFLGIFKECEMRLFVAILNTVTNMCLECVKRLEFYCRR